MGGALEVLDHDADRGFAAEIVEVQVQVRGAGFITAALQEEDRKVIVGLLGIILK